MKNIFFVLTLFPLFSMAGGMDAGGGQGVVCRDSRGKIKSIELLDLWEAKAIYGRRIVSSEKSLSTQVMENLDRLKFSLDLPRMKMESILAPEEFFLYLARRISEKFLTNSPEVRRLRGVKLTKTEDSYEAAVPADCSVEQIVTYVDEAQILVNQDLFERMNLTNQAALISHESFYAVLRSVSLDSDSIRVRRAIGAVASGFQFPSILNVLGASHRACKNPYAGAAEPETRIYLYEQEGQIQLLPSILFGKLAIGFFPAGPSAPSLPDFKLRATDSYCANPPPYTENLGVSGRGPVDFTNSFYVEWRCSDGHLSLAVFQRGPMPLREARTTVLTCEGVEDWF